MRFGRKLPKGFLPVFSVDTVKEARDLIIATCVRGLDGHYYSAELNVSQDLDTLRVFSDKLARVYSLMQASLKATKRA